jgi:hypothetical membrane protein
VNVKIIRVMARFGTLSPIIAAIIILISIAMTPEWNINQPLSDLGSIGSGTVLFNSGLLMAGSLAMLYAAGLFEFTKSDIIGQIGSVAFLIYAISTCVMGFAIIDIGEIQDHFKTLLYVMIPISSALLSINLYNRKLAKYALVGIFAALLGTFPWIMGGPIDAVKELYALIPLSLFQIIVGLYMYGLEEPKEFD